MDGKFFTSEGPDFYSCRDKLLDQYKSPVYDDASGLAPTEVDKRFSAIFEAPGMSRMMKKAALFELVLAQTRIDVDPVDWFADHFEGRNLLRDAREKWRSRVSDEELPDTAEVLQKASRTGAFDAELDLGHISPGWRYLLESGLPGLRTNLRINRDASTETAGGRLSPEQEDFYDAADKVLAAFIAYTLRLAGQADKMAAAFPAHADRMHKLSTCLRRLSEGAPTTLYEALQLAYLFHQLIEYEGELVRSMGSFDRNFTRFYEDDIASGRITKDDAAELIRFFWMKFFAKTRGADNGKNFYFGGLKRQGADATSELTHLALDVFYELEQTDPKFSIKLHKNSPDALYRQVARCIRDGRTSMVLINDDAAREAVIKHGKDPQDAFDYLLIGCYEPAIEGREIACNMSIKINLAKPIELVLNNGFDPVSGEFIGVDTGDPQSFDNYSEFFEAYKTQLRHQVELVTEAIKAYEPYWPEINPSPLLSSTFIDCVQSGVDVSGGGPKYNNTGCMGGCLGSAVDSLAAVKRLVYDEEKLTMSELTNILGDNWEGQGSLQAYAQNRLPKWGNNDDEADGIAVRIADFYGSLVNGKPNNRGGIFVASMFTLDSNLRWGRLCGALPDGRLAGTYLSKNIGATTAMDRAGVTAHIASVTKLDFTNIPNGSSLDIYLHPSAVAGEQGLNSLIGLIKTFFARGGFGIQFNVFDVNTLRDAQKNPQKYATLQVRVCGWNVYFITLSAASQEQFINTAVQSFA
ncbi:MAG: hypothetical protein FWH01_15040 [Oscillospiraceae bacterium]|nr:hypothetical protein [Oscillospiraceae bacterium]